MVRKPVMWNRESLKKILVPEPNPVDYVSVEGACIHICVRVCVCLNSTANIAAEPSGALSWG